MSRFENDFVLKLFTLIDVRFRKILWASYEIVRFRTLCARAIYDLKIEFRKKLDSASLSSVQLLRDHEDLQILMIADNFNKFFHWDVDALKVSFFENINYNQ